MPRSIWNGVVTFGMVSIPVGLYTATQAKDIRFNQIHKKCGSRIRLQKWCPVDEEVVDDEQIVKGYEFAKGQYVTLTEKDLEAMPIPSKHTIEVAGFVDAEEVDPLYYDTSYYLDPTEAGVKPFALFYQALERKKVSAIGKIALRSKENLCLLRPGNGTVVLETLYYQDELREPAASGFHEVEVDKKQLELAENLVELLRTKFEPDKFRDEYRDALLEMIETKREGGQIQAAPEAPTATKVYNLMDALKASLEAAKKPAKAEKPEKAEKAEKPARKRKTG